MNHSEAKSEVKILWVGVSARPTLRQGLPPSTIELATGGEALALAERTAIALVCCREVLPDMTGLQLLRRWRQQEKVALNPFVLILRRWRAKRWRQAMVAGADDVLAEPLGVRTFTSALQSQLQKQQQRLAQQEDSHLKSLPARLLGPSIELLGTCQDLQRHAVAGPSTMRPCMRSTWPGCSTKPCAGICGTKNWQSRRRRFPPVRPRWAPRKPCWRWPAPRSPPATAAFSI
ncbi:MAG: response regulator [Oscillatoriales cyanobacterium SM2_1_8]|nr:response regulator [Oscillatoriales cyanobacterium SM2_1_8]